MLYLNSVEISPPSSAVTYKGQGVCLRQSDLEHCFNWVMSHAFLRGVIRGTRHHFWRVFGPNAKPESIQTFKLNFQFIRNTGEKLNDIIRCKQIQDVRTFCNKTSPNFCRQIERSGGGCLRLKEIQETWENAMCKPWLNPSLKKQVAVNILGGIGKQFEYKLDIKLYCRIAHFLLRDEGGSYGSTGKQTSPGDTWSLKRLWHLFKGFNQKGICIFGNMVKLF